LTYLASGRDLLRLVALAPSRQGPVVIAAPDYDNTATPAVGHVEGRLSADVREIWFRPLHFAAEEGRAIARMLPDSTIITGSAATKRTVKSLAGPRLLHIATHGFFISRRPALDIHRFDGLDPELRAFGGLVQLGLPIDNPLLRSGIALAGANRPRGDEDDGILTALEVSQLDLTGTKLVVLSACETGLGAVHTGDGVYGLRRAMIMAGAETQVMSLWSVDDEATRELMEAYYEKLLAGGGRGEALREAQIEMLRRAGRAHPYYWASFIVSGNPAPLNGEPSP
jgi:CHAT domain-containing protein